MLPALLLVLTISAVRMAAPTAVAAAGADGESAKPRTDSSGQWAYVLNEGCATITRLEGHPGESGVLAIPGELDG